MIIEKCGASLREAHACQGLNTRGFNGKESDKQLSCNKHLDKHEYIRQVVGDVGQVAVPMQIT